MFSKSLKKKVAVLLTGAMVLGMTVTAFAADPITPAAPWNVAQPGEGEFEGHVNREVIAVDLPTIKAGHKPFNYVLDSEGLIAETSAVAYTGGWDANFGVTKEATTNVYFLQENDKYYNDSQAYTVSNNSSVSLNIAVKVTLPDAVTGDVEFVENKSDLPEDQEYTDDTANETAKIYLALKVGDEEKALKPGETISLNKVLADGYANYYVSENSALKGDAKHGYEFVISENKVAAAGDHPWADVAFSLTGKANKVKDASNVKAPDLELTWEYSKYEAPATPAGPTEFTVTFDSNGGSDVAAQTVEDGAKATEPTAPTKDGKNFGGWLKDGEAFDFDTAITADTTLVAKWNDPVTSYFGYSDSENKFWIGKNDSAGFDGLTAKSQVTSVKINDIDVTSKIQVIEGWIGLSWNDFTSLGGEDTDSWTMITLIDGVYYGGSF